MVSIQPIFQEQPELALLRQQGDVILSSLVQDHIRILDGIVGVSSQTKKTYKSNVKHFLHFIQMNGIHPHSFAEFRNSLELVNKSLKTKNAYLTSAKALLTEAMKYRILPIDITANIPNFKETKGHKKDGLTLAEVKAVSKTIHSITNERKRVKLNAIYHLLCLEGFRQIEVTRLTVDDFHPKDGFLLVHGKARQDKEKHNLMPQTIQSLTNYIENQKIHSGYIFPGNKGKQLSTRAIQKIFCHPNTGIFAMAGIYGKSVHGFRHFNITHTLELTSGNITKTAQRARLKTIETVIVYNDSRVSKEFVAELAEGFGDL